jgi:hypothetical protein
MALAKKILHVFVFPPHNINNKNVGSTKRDVKPRPNNNSRKSNKDLREGAGLKTYRS